MPGLGRMTRILLWCIVAGAVIGAGGFVIAASNVGVFGEPHGALLGVGVVMLVAGAIAFAGAIIGLLVLGISALLRNLRANRD